MTFHKNFAVLPYHHHLRAPRSRIFILVVCAYPPFLHWKYMTIILPNVALINYGLVHRVVRLVKYESGWFW